MISFRGNNGICRMNIWSQGKQGKTNRKRARFFPSPTSDVVYLSGQVGRTLVNPPFPTLLSTLFNPLPLSDSGLLTSLGSCSSWGFWNLVSFLWKTVIWSSCTAWSCCFLDEINHLKLALTSKLEPSSVFSFLPPTCSLNVPWLRPLLTTWVGGSGDAFNKQRGNWLRSQNCSIRGQSFGNNHHFQECFTNNFLLNIEKCFSLGTST